MKKLLLVTVLFSMMITVLSAQQTFPVNGVHNEKHLTYAFKNARIYVDYKTVIENATLVIKEDKIVDVGAAVAIPADAFVVDLKGKTIYPSFIDMYSDYGMPEPKKREYREAPQINSNTKGAYGWNEALKTDFDANKILVADAKKADMLRKSGFGTVMSFRKDGISRGTSVLTSLADDNENNTIIKDKAAALYSFDKGSSTQDYPSSLMGAIALVRQTYYDAQWYKNNTEHEYNITLDAWNKEQTLPQIFEGNDKLNDLRADKIGDEFNVNYIIKAGGNEYQRMDEVKGTKDKFILPLNFPDAYDVTDPYDAINVLNQPAKH